MFLSVLVVSFACLFLPETIAQNSICTPETKGQQVAKETVDKINGANIFPDDHGFLCRIAWVESKYGTDKTTYGKKDGKDYHGGIWQVDEVAYNETVKQRGIKRYRDKIKEEFGIDWSKTTWKDLRKPLYSALAARLYLVRINIPIPEKLQAQGEYWKEHYNSNNGSGTAAKFVKDVKEAKGCGN